MTSSTTHYQIAKHARFRTLDDEGLFIIQESGEVLAINKSAAQVVEWLRAKHSVEATAERLAETYDLDPARATQDVKVIVEELVRAGALEPKLS